MNKDMTKHGLQGSNRAGATPERDDYKLQQQKTKKWKKRAIIFGAIGGVAAVAAFTLTGLYAASLNNKGPVAYYKITFDAVGGQITGGDFILVRKNTQIGEYALPGANKQSMTFVGWSVVRGGSTPIDPLTVIDKDATYYAIWRDASQSEEENIIVAKGGYDYICDPDSICATTGDIKLAKVGSPEITLSIPRAEFNDPISIGKNISYLDNDFLSGCTSFDNTITLTNDSKLTHIGQGFMEGCTGFKTHTIQLPGRVRCISDSFMYGCSSFNQKIVLPDNVAILGEYFMASCSSFNKDFKLPATIFHVGSHFMHECVNMQSTLTVDAPIDSFMSQDVGMLSTTSAISKLYSEGVTIAGASADEFKGEFPNLPIAGVITNFYRKLK